MPTLAELRDSNRLRAVYLVEITPSGGGPTIYLSDSNVAFGGRRYEDYLMGVSGLGGREVFVEFKNERFGGHERLAQAVEGAECVIKEVLIGGGETETLLGGVLDSPQEMDGRGFRCRLLGAEFMADRKW